MDEQIKHRFDVLTWAIAFVAALTVAELGLISALAANAISTSRLLGEITGQLGVLVGHVQLK